MEIDEHKVDEISLALLYLTTFTRSKTTGDSEPGKVTVGMFWIDRMRAATLTIPGARPNPCC